ncbi:MAG: AAA family ATPase [Pirellulaceae bacterium]|nr:AAA family ATPase [Pirellulaceae bacterium]
MSESELTRHRVECESALVSIALRDPVAAIDHVLSIVRPSDFEDSDLGEVYDVLRDLHGAGFGIELEACVVELRKRGVIDRIGKHELRQILQAGYSVGNAEFYAREVARLADHRKVVAQARLVLQSADDVKADPQYLRDRFEAATRLDRAASTASTIAQCVSRMAQTHRAALTDGSKLGMSTGFKSLDNATSAMHRQQLWLLGARSNTGKTAFAVALASNLASGRTGSRRNVVMFSLEMSEIELAERCCADEIGINYSRFNHTTLEPSHLDSIDRYGAIFTNWPFVICDKSSLSVEEIASRAKIHAPASGPDLIIVDTLQRVRPRNPRADRRLQLQQITNDLKDVAKSLNCCVLLCAQLNAGAEGKSPDLTHLSEGKQVIEPVDTCVLMHRPDRNNPEVIFKIEKLRRGARKEISLDFDGKFQRFTEGPIVDAAPVGETWQG